MRTTLLFLSFIFIGGVLNAQITKGSKLIGGNLSFGSSKGESNSQQYETKSSYFDIEPSFGIAVKENLVIGGYIGYRISNNKTISETSESNTKTNTYSAGAFVRKYKQLGKSDFYLFGQASLYFYNWTEKVEAQNTQQSDRRRQEVGVNIRPGVSYAVNKRLHLELGMHNLLSAGFSYAKDVNGPTDYRSKGVFLNSDITNMANSLSFGVRLLLAK